MQSDFDPLDVLCAASEGIGTGRAFSEVHRLAEHVLGHPIWTHEFAEHEPWQRMAAAVHAQYPELRAWGERLRACAGNEAGALAVIEAFALEFPVPIALTKGTGERTESPFASIQRIAPDKPVMGIVVPENVPA